MRCFLDFETRSIADVTEVGADRYAADPSTQAVCFAYAFGEEPVELWKRGEPLPGRLLKHMAEGGDMVAHNAPFDMLIWNLTLNSGVEWKPEQTICTAAKCRAANLPASLDKVAEYLALPFQKMTEGKLLVARLSHPKTLEPLTWNEDEKTLGRMYLYCKYDIETTRCLDKAVPDLSESEREVWCLDYALNRRGIAIDKELCAAGHKMAEAYKAELNAKIGPLTGGAVTSLTQVANIKKWAESQGANLNAIGKKEVSDALLNVALPVAVAEVLLLRRDFSKTSATKLRTILGCLGAGVRAKSQFIYHGAATGRWAGTLGQFQNPPRFPRGLDVGRAIAAIKAGDVEAIKGLGFNPLTAVSGCIRALIVAGEGKLYGADFSSIEARVLAWLAGQNDMVERFQNGEDVYCYAASRIYGKPVTKKDEQERMVGKVAVLALGYGGGYRAFEKMGAVYGVKLDEERARATVASWREANRRIVSFWGEVENSARVALEFPGRAFSAGERSRGVRFCLKGGVLLCKLPSLRVLSYSRPEVTTAVKFGKKVRQISYMGKQAGKAVFMRNETYGGSLVENITQAVARDCMVEAWKNIVKAGYKPVSTIHDELVSEKEGGSVEEYCELMTRPISWAPGLPLAVEGWSGERYSK